MLTICGEKSRFCDGVSRRSFLQIGSLAVGGLSLPGLLAAERQAGRGHSNKSVIMVYLSGGLSHQDTFDLKPDAPDGIRGEFNPINTVVPGIQIGELLPMTAAVVDRLAILRSVVGQRDEHSSFQNVAGYPMNETLREGHPNFGSIISQKMGSIDDVTPPFVDLFPTMQHRPYNSPSFGSLGPRYAAIKADGEQLASMKLRYVTPAQFSNRRNLLTALDGYRRTVDGLAVDSMGTDYARAFDVLTSSRLVTALDVEKEDPKIRERYGKGSPNHLGDGAPMWNDQLLAARRLVESGVRCVTVAYGFWDTHGGNFAALKQRLPLFDQGISALVEDIYARGLDKDVTVVVWGEFGRTPKINKDAGRDHWARVNSALLAGGGMRVGQVLGATDKIADSAIDRPIHFREVLATIYHNLGIEPDDAVKDIAGRRVQILPPNVRPIGELVTS